MRYPNQQYPTRLGEYTRQIVKPVFKSRGLMEGKIMTHWAQIVGEKISQVAIADRIVFPRGKRTEGTLYLSVTSAGAFLLHYSQDIILDRVNQFFGYSALSKVHMIHDLVIPKKIPPPPPLPPLSKKDIAWLDESLSGVTDPDLKACLEKLGTALCR